MRRRPLSIVLAAVALALGAAAARAQDAPPSHGSQGVPTRASGVERLVDIPARLFEPKTLTALIGDTVTWRNSDTAAHDVEADDDSFDSGRLASGQTFSHTFTRGGRYPYVCSIHRTMNGVVEVFGLALSGPPRPVPYGGRATLAGLAAAGTRRVAIERRAGRGRWRPVRSVAAGADGRFRAVVSPRTSSAYRAVAGGRASRAVRVFVSARLQAEARRLTGGVSVRAVAHPAQPGAPAALERYVRERFDWIPIARSRLDSRSRVRFDLHPRGPVHLRVVLPRGVLGYGRAVSRVLVIR